MTGKVKNADQLKEALVLRAAGYSLASIAQNTGIAPATLSRHFAKHKAVKGGLTDEAIDKAKQQLLNDAGFISDLKNKIAASIVDDVCQVAALREAVSLTLEATMSDKAIPAHYRARSLAALATTLALTQKTARVALQADSQPIDQESLPTLSIQELTQDEIIKMREEQIDFNKLMGIPSGENEDDTIIETSD